MEPGLEHYTAGQLGQEEQTQVLLGSQLPLLNRSCHPGQTLWLEQLHIWPLLRGQWLFGQLSIPIPAPLAIFSPVCGHPVNSL